ncbi:amidohydrolase family protein [Streptomyces sp. UNOC14_S4]|uniref:amidohydrolase family protein n=1 Tax=Streptomyces sp. UNOC14_S4 TaxID=2872340 RepID=UPI001E62DDF9|nr:amidohydrolase family protein [Streptomyces sp. UNOC14_S4]MCC3769363.1 amidohydrolase family protein [Streptomyces sp. UNOC14_S4]
MLITAARLLTEPDAEYVMDGAVLVRGGAVVAVGPRSEVEALAGPGEERTEFPGGTLLPGLMDAHVHLCFDASADPVTALQERDDEELLADMRARAAQLLGSGVTTIRDLGDRNGLVLRLAREIANGTAAGPHIISAGTPATPPGGHCHFLGGEVAGTEEIRALVARNAAAGAEVVKVMETGGGLTKGSVPIWENQFTADELAELVAAARAAGLPVAAHAHGTEGIAAAVAAGVDTLEHCTWMAPGNRVDLREDVLRRIVEDGIRVCVTVSPNWRMLPQVFGAERIEPMFAAIRRMAEAGVRLVAGTDAGVQRTGFAGSLAGSLTFYEHLGVPARRVLAMATTEAAEALGIADRAGRIAPGYRADLLVVDGDPVESVGALASVQAVFASGERCAVGA